jgi:hypothetical protein
VGVGANGRATFQRGGAGAWEHRASRAAPTGARNEAPAADRPRIFGEGAVAPSGFAHRLAVGRRGSARQCVLGLPPARRRVAGSSHDPRSRRCGPL